MSDSVTALAIDGGAVDEIMAFIREKDLTLATVTNTHGHGDHIAGWPFLMLHLTPGDPAAEAGLESGSGEEG